MSFRKVTTLLSAVVLTLGLAVGLSVAAQPAAHAAFLPELCDNNGGMSLCFNQKGGIHRPGQPVVGWSAGDPNNYLLIGRLTDACGAGVVTSNCPFVIGHGLNNKYLGQPIVALFQNGNLCIGTNSDSSATVESLCPDSTGHGGGVGNVYVIPGWPDMGQEPYGIINVHWTNAATTEEWMCATIKGSSIYPSLTRAAHTCYWNTLVSQ